MPQIIVTTAINAPIKTCFNLARDVGFYCQSLKNPTEIPLSGKIAGLVEQGDYITWETNHLILIQHLTLKVTEFQAPYLFVDEMIKGKFKSYRHEHVFKTDFNKTIMIDKFAFESPYGIIGKAFDALFLKRHMQGLLQRRNRLLKQEAESL